MPNTLENECLQQLRDTCNSIAAQITDPPEVLEDDPTLVCEDEGYSFDEDTDTWTDKDCDEVATQTQSAYDYLSDVLDIEYRVGDDGYYGDAKTGLKYRSAEILVGFGGPNIWIDTKYNRVHGAWGTDRYSAHYTDTMGLDDACSELFAP